MRACMCVGERAWAHVGARVGAQVPRHEEEAWKRRAGRALERIGHLGVARHSYVFACIRSVAAASSALCMASSSEDTCGRRGEDG